MFETQEPYKMFEILTYEEFRDEMINSLTKMREIIGIYHGLLETNANPEREDEYKDRILNLSESIVYNLNILSRADIEKDYLLFYKEDGTIGIKAEREDVIKNLMERRKYRESLVV